MKKSGEDNIPSTRALKLSSIKGSCKRQDPTRRAKTEEEDQFNGVSETVNPRHDWVESCGIHPVHSDIRGNCRMNFGVSAMSSRCT